MYLIQQKIVHHYEYARYRYNKLHKELDVLVVLEEESAIGCTLRKL